MLSPHEFPTRESAAKMGDHRPEFGGPTTTSWDFHPGSAYGDAASRMQREERDRPKTRQPPLPGFKPYAHMPTDHETDWDYSMADSSGPMHNGVEIFRSPADDRKPFSEYTAWVGDMPVGGLGVHRRTGEMHMDVHPDFQRQGLGQAMMQVARNRARETGLPNPTLPMSLSDNSMEALHAKMATPPEQVTQMPGQGRLF